MRILGLLLMVAASSFMPRGGSASDEVLIEEIKGGISEVNRFSSPLVALQFTRRGEGENLDPGFSFMANTVFKDSVVNFAEVDLSDPANSEWVDLVEDNKYGHAIPTESEDGYRIMAFTEMLKSPLDLISYFKAIYVKYVVFPDTDRLGDVEGLRPHQAILHDLNATLKTFEAVIRDKYNSRKKYVSTSKKSSVRVGDTMVRPEELTSRDGSTILSLSGHGSILISGSTAGQTSLGVNPTVDGVDNDAEEDIEAVEILASNTRKVRNVAEKKDAKGRDGDVKGPLRKFMGFFGHGATVVRRGNKMASTDKDVLEDLSEDVGQGRAVDDENETGAADAERSGGVPNDGKDEGASSTGNMGKGNGVRRWFGWGKRRASKVEASLDGEVVMSVTRGGSLEVTYDGVRVLSKSGPHKWEWVNRVSQLLRGRRKSVYYEVHVVKDGFDMYCGLDKVWGATIASPCPTTDEP